MPENFVGDLLVFLKASGLKKNYGWLSGFFVRIFCLKVPLNFARVPIGVFDCTGIL